MEKHQSLQYLYIFFALVFFANLVNFFLQLELFTYIIGFFAIIMLVISFVGAGRLFKILGVCFMAVGLYFFFQTDEPVNSLLAMATKNLALLTFFSMLPWVNSVVKSGRFDRAINDMMSLNATDLGRLYWRSSITTYTLASFLNLPAATISQGILLQSLDNFKTKIRNRFINMTTLRGYTLALLWSPLEITVALSLFITGVEYVSVLPWVLLIAFAAFVLDSIIGGFLFKRYSLKGAGGEREWGSLPDLKKLLAKMAHFITALIVFLSLVILIGKWLELNLIITVTIIVFPFCYIWSLILKRESRFRIVGWNAWKNGTNNMHNFNVLFISLGIFSGSLQGTDFLNFIQTLLMSFADKPIIIMLLIQFIVLIMTMFGVHSVATLGVLSGLIGPLTQIIPPLSLTIVFIASAVSTFAVSTYGLLVTVTSMNTKQNPYIITVQNLPFTIGVGFIGILIAILLM